MTDGRSVWRMKDALWHDREWIVVLVDEFGAAGYAVADYLESVAKIQNDGGRLKTGPRVVSRATGVDPVTVCHVVSRSVTLGLLDEYEDHDGRFTCRITWFAADQGRALAARRQADHRAVPPVKPDDSPPLSRSVTPRHGESRSVTRRGKESRGEQLPPSAKAEAVPASPAQTDDERVVQEKAAYLAHLLSSEVRTARGVDAHSREALPVRAWHLAARAMMTLDGYSAEQIEFAIRWVCRHHYWSHRVRSMPRLRSEMAQVVKEIREQRDGHPRPRLRAVRENASDLLRAIDGGAV